MVASPVSSPLTLNPSAADGDSGGSDGDVAAGDGDRHLNHLHHLNRGRRRGDRGAPPSVAPSTVPNAVPSAVPLPAALLPRSPPRPVVRPEPWPRRSHDAGAETESVRPGVQRARDIRDNGDDGAGGGGIGSGGGSKGFRSVRQWQAESMRDFAIERKLRRQERAVGSKAR